MYRDLLVAGLAAAGTLAVVEALDVSPRSLQAWLGTQVLAMSRFRVSADDPSHRVLFQLAYPATVTLELACGELSCSPVDVFVLPDSPSAPADAAAAPVVSETGLRSGQIAVRLAAGSWCVQVRHINAAHAQLRHTDYLRRSISSVSSLLPPEVRQALPAPVRNLPTTMITEQAAASAAAAKQPPSHGFIRATIAPTRVVAEQASSVHHVAPSVGVHRRVVCMPTVLMAGAWHVFTLDFAGRQTELSLDIAVEASVSRVFPWLWETRNEVAQGDAAAEATILSEKESCAIQVYVVPAPDLLAFASLRSAVADDKKQKNRRSSRKSHVSSTPASSSAAATGGFQLPAAIPQLSHRLGRHAPRFQASAIIPARDVAYCVVVWNPMRPAGHLSQRATQLSITIDAQSS